MNSTSTGILHTYNCLTHGPRKKIYMYKRILYLNLKEKIKVWELCTLVRTGGVLRSKCRARKPVQVVLPGGEVGPDSALCRNPGNLHD